MKEEIIEGNILIAEFDGWTDITKQIYDRQVFINTNHFKLLCTAEMFQYNKDWKWLMPVVEKMNTMGQWTQLSYKELTGYWFEVTTPRKGFAESGKTGIEAVWKTVVEFIKWYNKIKSNEEHPISQ